MSTSVVAMTGLCIVLKYDNLTPALAGLAMSFAIQVYYILDRELPGFLSKVNLVFSLRP